jgi:hypothetical protein
LIEAKTLVDHGQWLPWLRENCALAERTAQLYMKIAKSGLESAMVADLGLQGAAEAIVGYIDYWSDLSDPELIEWQIFTLFLIRDAHFHIEGAIAHVEWLRRGNFKTPSKYLSEGIQRLNWWRPTPKQLAWWRDSWSKFFAANRHRTEADITAELEQIAKEHGPYQPPPRGEKKRTRRLRSDPEYTKAMRRIVRGRS